MNLLPLLADAPLTVDALARRAFPFVGTPMPLERAAYFAWRRVHLDELAAYEDGTKARIRKVSRALGKLQERGLVETFGPVRLAAWFVERAGRVGVERALASVHPDAGEALGHLGRYLDMLSEITGEPSPRVRHLCRTTARERRYSRLVEWGVVEPPSLRRLTFAGLCRVRGDLRRVETGWHRWAA